MDELWFASASFHFSAENPISVSDGVEVFIFDPVLRFLRVAPFGPAPQGQEDGMVDLGERPFAGDMLMIVCPSPDEGVELIDQVPGGGLGVRLDECANLGEKGFDVFGRGFDQDGAFIASHVLSQEVKSVFNVGNASLLGGEVQPPFLKELLYERFHVLFQDGDITAGDDKVIRKPDHVDFGFASGHRGSRIFLAELFLQTIEGQVG
jgi:hypothetical protein